MSTTRDAFSRRTLPAVLILIAATAAVFGQVGGHEFLVCDDDVHVTENPLLNPVRWSGVAEFWQRPYWGLYIPLSYTCFAGQMLAAGSPPDPAVFHLVNLGTGEVKLQHLQSDFLVHPHCQTNRLIYGGLTGNAADYHGVLLFSILFGLI